MRAPHAPVSHPGGAWRPQRAFDDGLLITRIAEAVAQVKGLGSAETLAFTRMVRARMAEPTAQRPAAFDGDARRQIYLTVVVSRLLRDWSAYRR